MIAQLGYPDMELPIQYALTWPKRLPISAKRLSLPEIGTLDFAQPDLEKFPCLRLCIDAGKTGGTAPVVVNAVNEIAVEAFLNVHIGFNDIAGMVDFALSHHPASHANTIEAIEAVDSYERTTILSRYLSRKKSK